MKQAPSPCWALLTSAIVVGLAGYYGPWVPHKAAGLVIIGLDLAEYVKFLPEVRSGQIIFPREWFYLPLLAASLTAVLLAGRRSVAGWLRVLFALAAIPLALAMLPPAWSPHILTTGEFRLQTVAIGLCLAGVPGILMTRRLPDRVVLGVVVVLCLAAVLLPAWAFLQVKPPIESLYNHPLMPGWGFGLCLIGFGAAAAIGAAEIARTA